MKIKPLHALWMLAMFALAGYFIWEWQHALVLKGGVREDPPSLPVLLDATENKNALKDILARNILQQDRGRVDDVHESGSSASMDQQWHLLATAVQQLDEPIAVISIHGVMKSMHEGDMLPDGAYLVLVMNNGIVVEQAGVEKHVYLFGKH